MDSPANSLNLGFQYFFNLKGRLTWLFDKVKFGWSSCHIGNDNFTLNAYVLSAEKDCVVSKLPDVTPERPPWCWGRLGATAWATAPSPLVRSFISSSFSVLRAKQKSDTLFWKASNIYKGKPSKIKGLCIAKLCQM